MNNEIDYAELNAREADRIMVAQAMANHPGLTEAEAIDILEAFGGLESRMYIDRAHAARKRS